MNYYHPAIHISQPERFPSMKEAILSVFGGVILLLSGCQYSSPHTQARSQSGTDGTPQPVASPFPDQPAGGMN